MAKRIIDWTVNDKGILNLNKYNADKDAKVETLNGFDLKMIYPEFLKFTDVQKHIVIYGAKQLLADSGANSVGDVKGKNESADKKFKLWLKGEIAGPRVNATNAAENKKRIAALETASKVVSLEGLIVKKKFFPDTFTKEDQKKLDEFMKIAVNG